MLLIDCTFVVGPLTEIDIWAVFTGYLKSQLKVSRSIQTDSRNTVSSEQGNRLLKAYGMFLADSGILMTSLCFTP